MNDVSKQMLGFCVTYLMLADNPDYVKMGLEIADRYGSQSNGEAFEKGVARAATKADSDENSSGVSTPTEAEIKECKSLFLSK